MSADLEFYCKPAWMTDPGQYAHLLDDLPTNIGELCKVVQGVTIHPFWTERYGVKFPPERQADVQLRILEPRLSRTLELDPRPLNEPRPPEKRLVGNCRDHTLLMVAILRHQGRPARARCGFGAYFSQNSYEDHWVAEYWNAEQSRWIMVDAQLDELQREVLKINFDPLDVPRDQFLVGGKAWQMCRSGQADPNRFGIFDIRGLDFVAGDMGLDLAALNKVELLPWDRWGLFCAEDWNSEENLSLLDHIANLTSGDVPDFDAVHRLYESNPRLRVGKTIESLVDGKWIAVKLPGI